MKLSIIVPVYNMVANGKLEFCLDSLLQQTIDDYEIIAIDDASTDASFEILNQYHDRYPSIFTVLKHARNKKQGGAKNTGLEIARGEWISFIDSDDWVAPDFYEKLLDKAMQTGADLVGCDYCLVSSHTFEVGEIIQNNKISQTGILDDEKHKSLLMRPGSMVIKIYKHENIKKNHLRFPESIFYEDNCAGPVWSLYFHHYEKVEEPLYYYYQHNSSTVHYITEQKCRNRMEAAQLLLKEMKTRGMMERYPEEVEYRFTELFYAITLFSYMLGVKHKKLSFVKELRDTMLQEFPDFQKNKYFQEFRSEERRVGKEC